MRFIHARRRSSSKTFTAVVGALLLGSMIVMSATAQTPNTVTQQGLLTDDSGAPLNNTLYMIDPGNAPLPVELEKTIPNPARKALTVRYAVPEETAGNVTVRLYDLLGRWVETVAGDAEAGRHEVQLSVGDLASGAYVVRLNAGEQMRTQRVTVVT